MGNHAYKLGVAIFRQVLKMTVGDAMDEVVIKFKQTNLDRQDKKL